MNSKISIKLLVAIVERGKGENIIEFLRDKHIYFNTVLLGRGTAPGYWSDLLSMGDSKKDVVLSVIDGDLAHEVVKQTAEKFDMIKPGHGIVFAININSVGGKKILNYFTDNVEDR